MDKQNQLKRTLSQPDSIKYIIGQLKQVGNASRTQLSDELCVQFNFFAPNGDKQSASCLKALRKLEQQGEFLLPTSPTRKRGQPNGQRRLDKPVSLPTPLPEEAGKIEQLKLIQVKTELQIRTWNELMVRDHPQGERPLVGRQVRYLVKSAQGYLGGIGFSSGALHLEARDRWIGWDWASRQEGLHYVVNLSRFLIREGVNCQNLASRVLGMAVRVLPKHFAAR